MIYEIEKLKFKYDSGDFKLNVNKLYIEKDEITGFVGTSGSGKTTLLLNLAFLLIGKWKVFKFEDSPLEVENLKSYRKKVTYVPQNPVLFSGTVESNIFYPLKLRKVRKEEAKGKIENVAEMLGIKHILKSRSQEISGGEAQRVCLARAFIFEPDVILLDEPTSNLDDKNKAKIESFLNDISERTKIIMVSHDLSQVRRLCKEIYRVEEGEISNEKV